VFFLDKAQIKLAGLGVQRLLLGRGRRQALNRRQRIRSLPLLEGAPQASVGTRWRRITASGRDTPAGRACHEHDEIEVYWRDGGFVALRISGTC